MNFQLCFANDQVVDSELIILSAFSKSDKKEIQISHWSKEHKELFHNLKRAKHFKASMNETCSFSTNEGQTIIAVGLGEKSKLSYEDLRKFSATIFKSASSRFQEMCLELDGFLVKGRLNESIAAIAEGIEMADYGFDRHLSKKREVKLKKIFFNSKSKKTTLKKAQSTLDNTLILCDSINYSRDLTNEAPNFLHSEKYASIVSADASKIKGVKVKVLKKAQLEKEKMGLFLSVNAGSHYGPRLVHLTYTPKKVTKNTKHITLVGKGLTFDSGGYSLKPSGSMINMKFDMAGSATVYAAFRAAAKLGANTKITCILGMTDNMVNSKATVPDSVIKARNGKTVEILNTDAEGRLVLADCLDYASDLKPDAIIDAATLTGAVLVSLGHEICGVMGNNNSLTSKLLKSAKNVDEYMWELPIIEEFHKDLTSPIADLKNIGNGRFGGTPKAAAFLSNFIKDDIPWAHLDIAGIGDSQGHLSYCPTKGASGLIVRSLVDFLSNQ